MKDSYSNTSSNNLLVRPLGLKINNWWRSAAAVLGVAGVVSGGVAVYVSHVEAGPVALIAAGLIFFLVAAGGRLPNRLRAGDNEATWESAVVRFVEDVAEIAGEVPAEQAFELGNALKDLADSAPVPAAAGISAISDRFDYHSLVASMLREAVGELSLAERPVSATAGTYLTSRTGFSMEIQYENRILLVDIIYSTRTVDQRTVADFLKRAAFGSSLKKTAPLKSLLITNKRISRQAEDFVKSSEANYSGVEFRHLVVGGREDMPKLVAALRSALEISR